LAKETELLETEAASRIRAFLGRPGGQLAVAILVLIVSLVVRLLLFRFEGYANDTACFLNWFGTAAQNGLSGFYDGTWCDYPPFNVYIFYIFGKLSQALGPDSAEFIIKLPQNLFDLATAFLIFSFLRRHVSFKIALGAMVLYAFNPAIIFDLAVWGQMDSIYTFFMVASLYSLFRSKYEISGAMFAVAILTKPQTVVLLPILAYVMLRNGGWRQAVSSSAVFVVLLYLLILPFNWDSPVAFLIDRYSGYGVYPYNSVNAYNFWALLGFWKADTVSHLGLTYQQWGVLAFVLFLGFVMWQLHRRYSPRAAIFAVFLLMFGFFMLMTRMHERYLFPVFAIAALLLADRSSNRWILAILLGLTGTFFANLYYVLSILKAGQFIQDGHWSIYVLVPINAVLLVASVWQFWRMQRPVATTALATGPPGEAEAQPPPKWRDRREWPVYAVALLTVLYFSLSVWNLGDIRFPKSDWTPQYENQELVLDVGEVKYVEKVYLLVQDKSDINVDINWGAPGDWKSATNLTQTQSGEHRKWRGLDLRHDTQYVRLLFKKASGVIGEVALFTSGEQVGIERAFDENGEPVAWALIDEQDLVYTPDSHMSRTYFDEIYFTRTAEDNLNLRSPSMWDHPQMGPNIIAVGIALFGENPFGWRIMGVIFATLMIPLIYDFARRLFKSDWAGVLAAFLLVFDFMHFAMARIGTAETYVLFFVMAMFYCFYRYYERLGTGAKWLYLSLIFFGFGFATKWVVMWGFVGLVLLLIFLKLRKPPISEEAVLEAAGEEQETKNWLVLLLGALGERLKGIRRAEVIAVVAGGLTAVAVYFMAYIPYFLAGHGIGEFWDIQIRAYQFHSGSVGTHPHQSEWYTWPIMLRPLWMYVGYFPDTRGYISSMGNPALWWGGIAFMLTTIGVAVWRRSKTAVFIAVPFLAQWLIFVPLERPLFIYHFYPNVLFIILAAVLCLQWMWRKWTWGKWVVVSYLILNVGAFIFLFPVISGYPMPGGYWDSLQWIVNWAT